MNCRSAEALFSSYIEDEISQEERRNLEAHLLGCRRCSLALREVKATVSVLERMPLVQPSAHFDEDVYARIRSGEGLRPSLRELVLELLSPARFRPVFMAGAGVAAAFAAFLISPAGQSWIHPAPATGIVSRVSTPAVGVASAPTTAVPSPERVSAPSAPAPVRGSVMASASRVEPVQADSIVDGRLAPQRFDDQIINDRFYLDRAPANQDPSVVPVNETQDDGVYIVF